MPESNWIPLRTAEIEAQIDPLGAQLSVLRDARGRDYLWHGDPAIWAGRSPILFPIVGAVNEGRYRADGKEYRLGRHGFARGSRFNIEVQTQSSTRLRLDSSAETLAVYPFPFQLDLDYRLDGNVLSMTASVRNTGERPMPASLGFHPGFCWPLPGGERTDHALEFEVDELAPIRRLDAQGLLSPQPRPTPVAGRRLRLTDELFKEDVVIFDALASRKVVLSGGTGSSLELGFPDARYLGLWTKPGAPFICIEPWQGVADPAGFTGDLADKPGVFVVEPGSVHSFGMTLGIRTT